MSIESRRRGARRAGAVLGAAALGVTVLPLGVAAPAEAAGFKKADGGAYIKSYRWLNKGKTAFDFVVQSKALGSAQHVRILLPKGWKKNSRQSWPTVYAYHGGNDNWTSWTRKSSTDIEAVSRKWGVMVVMPEGANGSYTNWYNYGKGGRPRWEDFHLREVVQLVQRNFHAGGSRAAIGVSSGAQGACTYAGRRPGFFKFAACYSGILNMTAPGIPALLMYTNTGNGNDPYAIWGRPILDDAVWREHNPIDLLPRMRGTKLYVSSGTTGQRGPLDSPNTAPWDIGYLSEKAIGPTVKDYVARARQLHVPITAHIYGNGRHSWPYWKREMHTSWPLIMKAIGARRA
ncbi:esterase family protein [Actinomadura barringtoniae]|uniref:Acyl-CoA:diacylglycerol acyltransferase n=1 Tax=Actinomadura barringtoniae TaxID=1427535 RepID=A0A939PHD1_9ACTN|nr:alpha/beta hydrolase-fold protein [Actinomadura barringtoniae]MBO2452892.1 esterase family protein [Actinomadura barringtoniae]